MDDAEPMTAVGLRPPDQVMRLARLGAFHQTRLSFLRVLLRRIGRERWQYARPVFDLDDRGVGHAVYTVTRGPRSYSLVAFAHDLPPQMRTDRVIAEAWDATFALFDGVPTTTDVARLAANVPRQEAGRYLASELVLARANRSVRLFESVVESLAQGHQPDERQVGSTGYLMRTTAVYGNGKFGLADRDRIAAREELAGPFQAEMLTVWLIRAFTVDLVEHLARARDSHRAVRLLPRLRRRLGIGNATGLGMAPFLVRHPTLIHSWIAARETALARVRSLASAAPETRARFLRLLPKARRLIADWRTDDPVQAPRLPILLAEISSMERAAPELLASRHRPWDRLYKWGEETLSLEGQELLVSLMLEPHGALVDDLAGGMTVDETVAFRIDGTMSVRQLRDDIERHYAFALKLDFSRAEATRRFWYVSEEKLEPRLGDRFAEPGADLELPLAIGRDVSALHRALGSASPGESVAVFLTRHPEHRHTVRRVQIASRHPYAEIRDNLIGSDLRAVDVLRAKLSFFGCTRFDPRSDKWLRITLFQDAPFPDEIGAGDWDGWIWGVAESAPLAAPGVTT